MSAYIVKHNQNIFDIAVEKYGTIEGVFDIMISNPQLSMYSDLKKEDELQIHPESFILNDGVVQTLINQGLSVQNGKRHVYYKEIDKTLKVLLKGAFDLAYISFNISGEGNLYIDWGDNSDIEHIVLTNKQTHRLHYFNNNITTTRVIKMYGDFSIVNWEMITKDIEIICITPLIIDEMVYREMRTSLEAYRLYENIYSLDLSNSYIKDLSPISMLSLQDLDLSNVRFSSIDVLDDYLESIVQNYGNRRCCKVILSSQPSQRGMDAIMRIIQEPAWNEGGQWQFIINGENYTYGHDNMAYIENKTLYLRHDSSIKDRVVDIDNIRVNIDGKILNLI